MATFSTNQVRQLYVVEALKDPNVAKNDAVGSVAVKSDSSKTHLYFEYKGVAGMTRSDLIDIKNIISIKSTSADDLVHNLAKYKLVLSKDVNSGNPISGQDYILRIVFKNYIGLSEEDQYFKYGMVHAVSGMTASEFYKTLAISLAKNFSRESSKLLKFYLETGGTEDGVEGSSLTEVDNFTKKSTLTGTYTGIVIEEAPQEWILGVFPQTSVNFTLQPSTVLDNKDERIWGTVNKITSTNKVTDGHQIADLEYFCMGERGDQYRMVNFPHVIRTKYLVNPDKEYDCIDIHYAYVGNNENVQKSEKTITLVMPKDASITETVLNKIKEVSGMKASE